MLDDDMWWDAKLGILENVQYLLDQGASVNAIHKPEGDSCLHIAAKQGHLDIVILLLENNANISLKNKKGETPIESAAHAGKWSCVIAIAERRKRQWFDSGNFDWTLFLAVLANKLEAVSALLDAGAKPHKKNWVGQTCLHVAAWRSSPEVVEQLLDHGASKYEIASNQYPFHIALDWKSWKKAYLLVPDENSLNYLNKKLYAEIKTLEQHTFKTRQLVVLFCDYASPDDVDMVSDLALLNYEAACNWMVNYYANQIENASSSFVAGTYKRSMLFFVEKAASFDSQDNSRNIETPDDLQMEKPNFEQSEKDPKATKQVPKFKIKPIEEGLANKPENSLRFFLPPPPSCSKPLDPITTISFDGDGSVMNP